MQVIALQQYTDKTVSLYEGEIRNISDSIAQDLIDKGIVAEHDQGSGSTLVIPITDLDMEKISDPQQRATFTMPFTSKEIYDKFTLGTYIILNILTEDDIIYMSLPINSVFIAGTTTQFYYIFEVLIHNELFFIVCSDPENYPNQYFIGQGVV